METKTIEVWYAVDKDGGSFIYDEKPERHQDEWLGYSNTCTGALKAAMPELTWDDESVKMEITVKIS